MIVVDTSVWVAAFRSKSGSEAAKLSAILDEDRVVLALPVRIEILLGASRKDLPRLRRILSALPVLEPAASTWQIIDKWIDRAVAAGQRFGMADLIIGALCAERGHQLWSLDSVFGRMEKLGLVKRYH